VVDKRRANQLLSSNTSKRGRATCTTSNRQSTNSIRNRRMWPESLMQQKNVKRKI